MHLEDNVNYNAMIPEFKNCELSLNFQ